VIMTVGEWMYVCFWVLMNLNTHLYFLACLHYLVYKRNIFRTYFSSLCVAAYACPSKDDITSTSSNTKTLLEGSDTESFEEVSESDLQELAAHKSALSNGSDTLTSVSLTSLQSKPEADQTVNNGKECVLLQTNSVFFLFWKF
jgi:hypothetical protein